jgi:class 3 adenylate cyclase
MSESASPISDIILDRHTSLTSIDLLGNSGATFMAGARVERRLAAVLAADVVGYSRLMAVDEEGTLAALKAYRRELIDPKIAEHRGRIVKTTGDGILVEFTSAVDAVYCAIEIQQTIAKPDADLPESRRIEMRIGVNIGDVIVDDGDIYGDGVNSPHGLKALPTAAVSAFGDKFWIRSRGSSMSRIASWDDKTSKT